MLDCLDAMKHSPVANYGGIPGLTSWLVGEPSASGLVRLMECSRDHQEPIIPHSHRFDFHCRVLSGSVRNLIWEKTHPGAGDAFQVSALEYAGAMGRYQRVAGEVGNWAMHCNRHQAGEEYSMKADEVHSIFFARGTVVLFFEGPKVSDSSIILQPFVDGEAVPTFKVEPWMFKRLEGGAA
jgi:hypothetical protein